MVWTDSETIYVKSIQERVNSSGDVWFQNQRHKKETNYQENIQEELPQEKLLRADNSLSACHRRVGTHWFEDHTLQHRRNLWEGCISDDRLRKMEKKEKTSNNQQTATWKTQKAGQIQVQNWIRDGQWLLSDGDIDEGRPVIAPWPLSVRPIAPKQLFYSGWQVRWEMGAPVDFANSVALPEETRITRSVLSMIFHNSKWTYRSSTRSRRGIRMWEWFS